MKELKVIGYALVLDGEYFIPDFSVEGYANDIYQIHSTRKSAEKVLKGLKSHWNIVKVEIKPTPLKAL